MMKDSFRNGFQNGIKRRFFDFIKVAIDFYLSDKVHE